jgi:hypothetical protein
VRSERRDVRFVASNDCLMVGFFCHAW